MGMAKGNLKLYRSETNKVIAGVCAGLAEVFNVDVTLVRIIFLLAFAFGGGGLLIYIILWIVMPTKSGLKKSSEETIKNNLDEMKEQAQNFTENISSTNKSSGTNWFAIILIVLGLIFLLDNFGFGHIFDFGKLWPLILIAFGFMVLNKK